VCTSRLYLCTHTLLAYTHTPMYQHRQPLPLAAGASILRRIPLTHMSFRERALVLFLREARQTGRELAKWPATCRKLSRSPNGRTLSRSRRRRAVTSFGQTAATRRQRGGKGSFAVLIVNVKREKRASGRAATAELGAFSASASKAPRNRDEIGTRDNSTLSNVTDEICSGTEADS
jgi:hypothetical protein